MTCAGVCVLTVDKFGRRPLLLLGVGGMCASALIIGIACQIAYSSVAARYITIVLLFVFVGSYQVTGSRGSLLPGSYSLMCRRLESCRCTLDGQRLVMLHGGVFLPTGVRQYTNSRHAPTTIVSSLRMHAICRQCHEHKCANFGVQDTSPGR